MADRGRVLVVDDEDVIRDVLEMVLAEEGYEVRAAADGQEALATLDRWRPDVIVLDLMMPVMDGWTFREEQRRRRDLADVPVVVLSGAREVRANAERLGARAAIAKPFDIEDVLAAVAREARAA